MSVLARAPVRANSAMAEAGAPAMMGPAAPSAAPMSRAPACPGRPRFESRAAWMAPGQDGPPTPTMTGSSRTGRDGMRSSSWRLERSREASSGASNKGIHAREAASQPMPRALSRRTMSTAVTAPAAAMPSRMDGDSGGGRSAPSTVTRGRSTRRRPACSATGASAGATGGTRPSPLVRVDVELPALPRGHPDSRRVVRQQRGALAGAGLFLGPARGAGLAAAGSIPCPEHDARALDGLRGGRSGQDQEFTVLREHHFQLDDIGRRRADERLVVSEYEGVAGDLHWTVGRGCHVWRRLDPPDPSCWG